jgi:ABC-type multidrug transport system fused ATPase/permease subunit
MNVPGATQDPLESDLLRRIEELVPAYALGAADADEAAAVLRAAGDGAVAQTLAAYSRLAEALLYSAPPAALPPGIADRLSAALDEPAVPRLAAPIPVVQPQKVAPESGRTWHWPVLAALAAAAAAVLLLLNFYWINRLGALDEAHMAERQEWSEQNSQLAAQLADMERQLTAKQQQVATQDALLASLVVRETERYTMDAVDPQSSAVARVTWVDEDNVAILRAEGFPPLPPDQAYQLWLLTGDDRTSGGLFTVDEYGCGTFVFHPTQSLDDFDGMGITPEPAAGSSGPTTPPVVRAQL